MHERGLHIQAAVVREERSAGGAGQGSGRGRRRAEEEGGRRQEWHQVLAEGRDEDHDCVLFGGLEIWRLKIML